MRRLFSWLGYGFFGIFLLGALFPDDDAKTAPSAPDISNTQEKLDLFEQLPKSASLNTQAPQVPNPPKLAEPKVTPEPSFVYVTGNRVNLRAGPSTNFKVLGTHVRANKLVLLDTENGWSRISGTLNGRPAVGWMSSKFLSTNLPAKTLPQKAKPQRSVAVPATRNITAARKAIIRQSIAAYPGSCPCDYNRDRAGRRCGKRSAWSRRGGYAPLCYNSDVTQAHLNSYYARNR